MIVLVALMMAQGAAGDADPVRTGERIFAQNCTGYCHGASGEAGHAPRLRGRGFEQGYVLRVVRDGIARSSMPAWKGRLSDHEIAAVVRYVESLSSGEAHAAAQPATAALPSDVERGRALFFDAMRDTPCSACHQVDGHGTAAGPDVRRARTMAPGEVEHRLRGAKPRHMVTIRTRSGETFPGVVASEDDSLLRVYDLAAALPVLRTFERSQIAAREPLREWSHAAYLAGLDRSQIADLIAYLRWN